MRDFATTEWLFKLFNVQENFLTSFEMLEPCGRLRLRNTAFLVGPSVDGRWSLLKVAWKRIGSDGLSIRLNAFAVRLEQVA